MNTHALSDAPVQSRAVPDVPVARRFYWLIRREILENRSIYLAPLAVMPFVVIGFTLHLGSLPRQLREAAALDPMHQQAILQEPYTAAALLLMFIGVLVAVFYCVDALYGDRRDRSILFWKSLPVSDLETVLAKASIPMVVIPLVTFVATFSTHLLILTMSSMRLAGTGLSLWPQLAFGQMTWILFYHLLIGHGFWFAPFWGWFLLASAWARRAPFLWATVPLLALGLLEQIAFHTTGFARWLQYRFTGGPVTGTHTHETLTIASVTPGSWSQFLTSPGFWFGLALTAVFLALAVHFRRQRGPN